VRFVVCDEHPRRPVTDAEPGRHRLATL
jgi:hypothetical protein